MKAFFGTLMTEVGSFEQGEVHRSRIALRARVQAAVARAAVAARKMANVVRRWGFRVRLHAAAWAAFVRTRFGHIGQGVQHGRRLALRVEHLAHRDVLRMEVRVAGVG